MKIGIVTFVKADNYGAELQAYALQKKLNCMGYDAEVLDLEKEEGVMSTSKKNIITSLKNRIAYYGIWKGTIKFVCLVIDSLREKKNRKQFKDNYIQKHIIFENFFKEKIKHSPNHIMLSEVYDTRLPYDVYIAGSDQIWNYMQTRRLDVYFLKFANRFKAKKISYAASFSVSKIPEDLKHTYKELINNIDSISVRETNAINIVKTLTNRNAEQVLDPTLLLTKQEWVDYVSNKHYSPVKGEYIIVYTLSGSKYIYDLAKDVAHRLGDVRIINIKDTFQTSREEAYIINLFDAGPSEFITLFSRASYVITDSFHGTAFSINFNIPFTTMLNPVSNMNQRALSLLELTGLKNDRLIYDDGKGAKPYSLTIDFSEANRVIKEWREKSVSFLIKNLS